MVPEHQPVLLKEIIHALRPNSRGRYVDGTLGAGGHAYAILAASEPEGRLLGFDVDPQALKIARRHLAPFGERAFIKEASYTNLEEAIGAIGWEKADGILLDLGASSMQFDTAGRGFSFLHGGPLDMRFDPTQSLTAEEVVNTWTEQELADVIYKFGEEREARRIARTIARSRPIKDTLHLAEVIEHVKPRRGVHHPATLTFQALRIMVNHELESIEKVLPAAVRVLAQGGRLAVISFHSLEDRLVKDYFRLESRDCICPPKQPICTCGHKASIKEINRRPITPSNEEMAENPRARSAKLRIVEKL